MDEVYAWVKIKEGHYRYQKVSLENKEIKHYNFICKKCKKKNDYYAQKNCFPYRCQYCRDTGVLPDISQTYFGERKIPTWRLNIDDAPLQDLLKKPLSEFGAPSMSHQQWMQFYSAPHEVKKQQEVAKVIRQIKQEVLETRQKDHE